MTTRDKQIWKETKNDQKSQPSHSFSILEENPMKCSYLPQLSYSRPVEQ